MLPLLLGSLRLLLAAVAGRAGGIAARPGTIAFLIARDSRLAFATLLLSVDAGHLSIFNRKPPKLPKP